MVAILEKDILKGKRKNKISYKTYKYHILNCFIEVNRPRVNRIQLTNVLWFEIALHHFTGK
jgi:hypothetical protein